ncbi:MAG: penicillin-binding protein 2 [Candidatus Calescibacterium sp.]|nr:penicillin-binding protein 2 [Candidatus Calescibacterium sp.]
MNSFQTRTLIFYTISMILFAILIGRFFYLQIYKGEEIYEEARSIKTRIKLYPPERGEIYTSDEVLVATNIKTIDVTTFPMEIKGRIPQEIYDIFGKDKAEELRKAKRYYPFVLKADVNYNELAEILPTLYNMPYISFETTSKRFYPLQSFASHVIGHIKTEKYYEYRGVYGVEAVYDEFLRGEPSKKIVEINAFGKELKIIEDIDGKKGQRITLTLLAPLQMFAEELMKDKEGAIVVMNPNNGEILTLVSAPYYDINIFSRRVDEDLWRAYFEDVRKPFLNRAISSEYPPGSVFKILVAIAALEEKRSSVNESVRCRGIFHLGDKKFRCWKKEGHGTVSFQESIIKSCDVFFYNLGVKLGVDRIHKWAKKFGLTEKTGIDLFPEAKGLVPSTEWKKKVLKDRWYPGENIPISIGQGYVKLTPLQVARFISAVANGGYLVHPHVVKKIGNKEISYPAKKIDGLSSETLNIVKEAMVGVVEWGTAARSKIPNIKYGGKTGTSQVISLSVIERLLGKPIDKIQDEEIPKNMRDHAWFAAFAPAEKPEIVAVAIVEHSGAGSKYAAPIVKQIIEKYFEIKNNKKDIQKDLTRSAEINFEKHPE